MIRFKKQTVLLLCLVIIAACGEQKEIKSNTNPKFTLSDSMMHMIALDTVRYCNISDEVSLSGQVGTNENNQVKIFPRSSGQVISCSVSLGDHVRKGQVLAVIRSADVAGNYSEVSSANADVSIAKRELDNTESLYKNGISSEREYITAKESYQKALAAKSKAEAALNINGGASMQAGGQYSLISPIDGYIVSKKITAGAFIRPDMAEELFTISDLKDVWINANVYESDISKVKEGYPVVVSTLAYPGKTFNGTISKVSQVLDAQSKAMTVRIVLPNPDLLFKPDMFAKVIVQNQEGGRALCIPSSAIISQDGKSYVVVFKGRDDVSISEINIMKTVGDKVFLDGGLQDGQCVITKKELMVFNQIIINSQQQN